MDIAIDACYLNDSFERKTNDLSLHLDLLSTIKVSRLEDEILISNRT